MSAAAENVYAAADVSAAVKNAYVAADVSVAAENAYAAADAWRRLASAAQDALADAGGAAGALVSNNSGGAVDAFERRWREAADPGCGGPLPRLVRECLGIAERCEGYAAEIVEAASY